MVEASRKGLQKAIWRINLIVLPIVIVFVLLYSFMLSSMEQEAYEKVIDEERRGTYLVANLLESSFELFVTDCMMLYRAPQTSEYVEHPDLATRSALEELFVRYAEEKSYIKTLRIMDPEGMETIRVDNRTNDVPFRVAAQDLQDKRDRTYTAIFKRLGIHELYISEMDLQEENGTIVEPYEPIIRLGFPLYRGTRYIGYLIVNFDAYHILSYFSSYLQSIQEDISFGLINQNGDWIVKNNEYVFGFRFHDEGTNLLNQEPAMATAIGESHQGQMETDQYLYYFHSVDPIRKRAVRWYPGTKYIWTVVGFMDKSKIPQIGQNIFLARPSLKWIFAILIFLIVGTYMLFYYQNKHTRQQEKISSLIAGYTVDGILATDRNQRIIFCNKPFERLSGYTEPEIIGKIPTLLAEGFTSPYIRKILYDKLPPKGRTIRWRQRKNGNFLLTDLTVTQIDDDKHRAEYYVAHYRHPHIDIFDSESFPTFETNIHTLPLYFLKTAIEKGQPFACMVLQIVDFAILQNTFHQIAPIELTTRFSKRLAEETGTLAPLFIYAQDTFLLLLSNPRLRGEEEAYFAALMNRISVPVMIDGKRHECKIACGISLFPQQGRTEEALLRNAFWARELCRDSKEGCFQIYSPVVHTSIMRKRTILKKIPQAFTQGHLQLYYQPQLAISDNTIIGAEALIRWNDPELGFIPPNEFIPLMEQNDMTRQLGLFVIATAIDFLSRNEERLQRRSPRFCLAINLTARELATREIGDFIEERLKELQVPSRMLALELTERTVIENFTMTNTNLRRFRKDGISIAIDDFGTGFSSLSYLAELAMDKIKIDKQFLDNYRDPQAMAVIKAIISMARELHITVLAEGVETRKQRDFLVDVGCAQYQGYYFSKAIPEQRFLSLLEENQP